MDADLILSTTDRQTDRQTDRNNAWSSLFVLSFYYNFEVSVDTWISKLED